eukprot:snap_masked-scaffold_52-processed-gene-0.10-mRNA-1 protein AED:1.00 eAED:1.00 QI:0/-1/0/0/-1/1/1/0/640
MNYLSRHITIFYLLQQLPSFSGESICTSRALKNLNADKCFSEIQEQFNWLEQSIPQEDQTCRSTKTFFLFDSSTTVRKTCKREKSELGKTSKCLEDVQKNYIRNYLSFTDIFTGDEFETLFFATDTILMEKTSNELFNAEEFVQDVNNFLETEYLENIFTGNNQGWSRSSKGFEAIANILSEESEDNVRPVVVLFTDGRIERRNGGISAETKATKQEIARLSNQFTDLHVHCVVMNLDGDKSENFWNSDLLCDSKDLVLEARLDSADLFLESKRFVEKLAFIHQRNILCKNPEIFESFIPSTAPTFIPTQSPSTTPTTLSPTFSPNFPIPSTSPISSPTLSPSGTPSTSPTHSPTETPTEAPTSSPTEQPTITPSTSPSESPTLPPSHQPTFNPTTPTTGSPTSTPTCAFVQEIAVFSEEQVSLDNLCGINSFFGDFQADPELRFTNVFSQAPNLDVVVRCQSGAESAVIQHFADSEHFTLNFRETAAGFLSFDVPVGVDLPLQIIVEEDGEEVDDLNGVYIFAIDIDGEIEGGVFVKDNITFCEGELFFQGSGVFENIDTNGCSGFEGIGSFNIETPSENSLGLFTSAERSRSVVRRFSRVSQGSVIVSSFSEEDSEQGALHRVFLSFSRDTDRCLNQE